MCTCVWLWSPELHVWYLPQLNFYFTIFPKFKKLYLFIVCEDTRAIACCEGQMTAYKSWFSSVLWAPGIQLRQQCINPLSHLTDPLHLSFLMQGLSLNPKLTNFAILAGPRVPGICPSPPLQHRDTGPLSCAHLFIGLAGSNWGLYTLQGVRTHVCTCAQAHKHTNTQTLAPHTPLGRPVEEAKDSAMTQDLSLNLKLS